MEPLMELKCHSSVAGYGSYCHGSGGSAGSRGKQLSGKFCSCLASSSAHVIDAIQQEIREGGLRDCMGTHCPQMFGAGLFKFLLLLAVALLELAHVGVNQHQLIHAVEVGSCFVTSSEVLPLLCRLKLRICGCWCLQGRQRLASHLDLPLDLFHIAPRDNQSENDPSMCSCFLTLELKMHMCIRSNTYIQSK